MLGLPGAANAATVAVTDPNGLSYQADDANVAAGATVTGYTGTDTALVIPATVVINGVTYAVTSIAEGAFSQLFSYSGPALTSVVIPDSVTTIEDYAFLEQNSLTSITLPDGLTKIGNNEFEGDPLGGHLTIPAHVTEISGNAFAQTQLTSVTFPDSLTIIDGSAFQDDNLGSVVIPASVNEIDSLAFEGNPGLTSVMFEGAAPVINPAGNLPSLGATAGLVVSYLWAHDAAQQTGGFTSPTWQGYNTRELVTTTFNANGFGTAPAPVETASGSVVAQPADPTASGEAFIGWYTTAALTTKVNFADPVTADQTIYAGWERLATTGVSVSPLDAAPGVAALALGGLLLALSKRRRRIRA